MPWKQKTPCREPGCSALCHGRLCDRHKPKKGSATERGYNYRWRIESKLYLKGNPLCRPCEMEGKLTPATEVDHIEPHRGNRTLFWDRSNWQPICVTHHRRKSRLEMMAG